MNLHLLRNQSVQKLKEAFSQNSAMAEQLKTVQLDVDLLLCHFLNQNRTWITFHREFDVDAGKTAAIEAAVERRATGLPVAYITGHKEFFGLDFFVTPDVLIPKPDTETLIELALQKFLLLAENADEDREFFVCDMCSGSGCVGISFLKAIEEKFSEDGMTIPRINVFFADISEKALLVTQENIRRILGAEIESSQWLGLPVENAGDENAAGIVTAAERLFCGTQNNDNREKPDRHGNRGGAARIKIIRTNLFEMFDSGLKFDLILTNPPYVPHSQSVELLKDGRNEPLLALDGDVDENGKSSGTDDGLALIRRLVPQCAGRLRGFLLMETGEYNAEETALLFEDCGFEEVCVERDLNGMQRCVCGKICL